MELASPPDIDPLERLATSIREREAVAAVIGLGYVGLPLLVAVHQAGFRVIGLDNDADKVASLRAGRSTTVAVGSAALASLDRATFDADPSVLADADVVVPLTNNPVVVKGKDNSALPLHIGLQVLADALRFALFALAFGGKAFLLRRRHLPAL